MDACSHDPRAHDDAADLKSRLLESLAAVTSATTRGARFLQTLQAPL